MYAAPRYTAREYTPDIARSDAERVAESQVHPVCWASDTRWPAIEDVRVDHRGAHVAMTKKFLDGSDVAIVLEEVGGKRVPQGVTSRRLGDAGVSHGVFDRPLQDGFVKVMTAALASLAVDVEPGGGKHPLPGPLAAGIRILASQRPR